MWKKLRRESRISKWSVIYELVLALLLTTGRISVSVFWKPKTLTQTQIQRARPATAPTKTHEAIRTSWISLWVAKKERNRLRTLKSFKINKALECYETMLKSDWSLQAYEDHERTTTAWIDSSSRFYHAHDHPSPTSHRHSDVSSAPRYTL